MDRLCSTESEVFTFVKATPKLQIPLFSPIVFSVRQIEKDGLTAQSSADVLDEDGCYVFKMAAIIPRVG